MRAREWGRGGGVDWNKSPRSDGFLSARLGRRAAKSSSAKTLGKHSSFHRRFAEHTHTRTHTCAHSHPRCFLTTLEFPRRRPRDDKERINFLLNYTEPRLPQIDPTDLFLQPRARRTTGGKKISAVSPSEWNFITSLHPLRLLERFTSSSTPEHRSHLQ